MRSGVRKRMQRLRMLEHRAHRFQRPAQVVENREIDEVAAVALGEVIVDGLEGTDAAYFGARGERLARQGLVIGVIFQHRKREHERRHLVELREDLVHERRDRRTVAGETHRLFSQDARLDDGIAQARSARGQRQCGEFLVGRHRHENVEAGIQAVEHADRAAGRLQANLESACFGSLCPFGQPLPLRGRIHALEPRQCERSAGRARNRFEQVVFGVEADPLTR